MEELRFMKQLMKERVSSIISKIPAGFLMKSEAKLLIHILFQYEQAIAFTDLEHGMFSQKYYHNYVIRTVPHHPWKRKLHRKHKTRHEEVNQIMKEQISKKHYK